MTGEAVAHAELDTETKRSMLRAMLEARGIDEEATLLQKQGAVDLWLSCRGQEAAQVGSAFAAGSDPVVFPSYREHAVALVRGVRPEELIAQWAGRTLCGWRPRELRFFPYTLVLAAQTLHAVGYALGRRLRGCAELVLVYVGDGATSEGDMSEALNLAAVESAPVLFLCQNNGWAISKPAAEQMATTLAERAGGFGIRSARVDGGDPEVVHRATARAADMVRRTGQPYLLEMKVDRVQGHSTADSQRLYRDAVDIERAEAADPVTAYTARLMDERVVDREWLDAVAAEVAHARHELAGRYQC
ncbi:thiamine pyrophosphate-dependent dehydrogenase E1 component subunit alpha [Nocardia crassostreae]|uniref:thiamine pyrophosphate-dependent dehydrogenase E1 component subunit alpha n=1 Tax=Nocardia crassostreae TaxID=53428 RepID=UPI000B2A2934|nr:thiamine pyrophosphate-dependent enzyme [Nocardia crassostreae]